MHKPSKLAARVLLQLRKQREREHYKQYQKIISRFRPRKSERSSYVYINLQGKRQEFGAKKIGFLLYVKKDGSKKVLAKNLGRNIYKPTRPLSISTSKVRRQNPSAYKKQFEAYANPRTLPKYVLSSRGINFERVCESITRDLIEQSKRLAKSEVKQRWNVIVQVSFKGLGTHEFKMGEDILFGLGDQEYNFEGIKSFILKGLHSQIRAWLLAQDEGYVTKGSAEYVKEIYFQRKSGYYYSKKKGGVAWSGNGKKIIGITRLSYQIIQISWKEIASSLTRKTTRKNSSKAVKAASKRK